MDRLPRMVRFNVWNVPKTVFPVLSDYFPHVRRVFALRITRRLSFVWPFIMPFSGILGRDTVRVQVERVITCFGKPKERFVTSGEAFAGVQSMFKMPDDPVPQLVSHLLKNGVIVDIQRIYFAFFHKVTYLPANTALWMEYAVELLDCLSLKLQILFDGNLVFVCLSKIVGRRGDDELD